MKMQKITSIKPVEESVDREVIAVVEKTKKELKPLVDSVGINEMRELVDTYYQRQNARIREGNRAKQAAKAGLPCALIEYFGDKERATEEQIKYVLGEAIKKYPIGKWLTSICGIGPVLAAGLVANIDIHRSATYGALQRYAGLDPTSKWEKGQKRPWNAKLKTLLAYKCGESFVKCSSREKDFYGHLYKEKKTEEAIKNEQGFFKEQALKCAERVGKTTEAYKWYSQGMLPPAHLHARARRYAVKLFISHLFTVWKTLEGEFVPLPYPHVYLGHAHIINPPNLDVVGLTVDDIRRAGGLQPIAS